MASYHRIARYGLILLLLLGGCTRQERFYAPDPNQLKQVEAKVREGRIETPTFGDPLIALGEHAAFMSSYFGEKSEVMASAMHRLADLYMILEDRAYQEDLKVYQQRLRLHQEGRLRELPEAPIAAYTRSLRMYEKLLEAYPNRPENDRILYQLARIDEVTNRPEQRDETFKRLLEQYPNSQYAAEAQFRLAESYFSAGMFEEAAATYQAAAKAREASALEQARTSAQEAEPLPANIKRREEEEWALYRSGWIQMALNDYKGAIDTFRGLLDRKQRLFEGQPVQLNPKVMSAGEWDFVQEVLRGMAIAFTHWGPPTKIQDYFESTSHRDYEYLVYRKLGDVYQFQKRILDAIKVYEAFLKSYLLHPQSPHLVLEIIEAYQRIKLVDLSNSARIRFVEEFGEGSLWYENASEASRAEVRPLIKRMTYQLALFYHSEAQKTRRSKDYEKAIQWDQRFLQSYPEEIEASRINLLLAEGLYELGRHEEAATEYERTAYGYPLHQNSAEAGYATIVALERLWTSSVKAGTDPKDNPSALRLAQSCARFAKAYPSDSRVLDVKLKGAEIFFKAGHFQEGRGLAEEITKAHLAERHPTALRALRLIANSYFEEGAYEKAAFVYRQLEIGGVEATEREEIRRLWASALYKQAEALKAAGKLPEAEAAFRQVQREVPGSEVAPVALYDAGVMAMDRGDLEGALGTFGLLVSEYDKAPHSLHAALQIARIHEQQGRLKEAALEYQQIPALTEDRKMAAEALLRSAGLYEQLGEWGEVERLYQRYLDSYAAEFEIMVETRYKLIGVKQRLGLHDQAKGLLAEFIKQYSSSQEGSFASGGKAQYYLAKAYLASASYLREEYEAIRLVSPLEDNLAKKKRLLAEVLDLYLKSAEYGFGEATTEATYQIGTAFESFRTALLGSERPQGLTPQQLEQYNFLLEEQAYPFEEKAIAAYESNVKRTWELGLYGPWVKQSYDALAHLLPGRYQRPEKKEIINRELMVRP